MHLLIVDDEPNIRRTLRLALESSGHKVWDCAEIAQATRVVDREPIDLAFVDLRLGVESGLDLLDRLSSERPRMGVILITAHANIDIAVESMRRGAFDFLPKPFTPAQVRAMLERFARERGLRDRVDELETLVKAEFPEVDLESQDPRVKRIFDQARQVAPTDAAILIRGENGTGKGVMARAIHSWSNRRGGPFVTVSCPSLSAELLESDLFGHVRGAFTGAVRDAQGKVSAAQGGTLFLDEIGDLPIPLQPKLLRFLQERRYERVGETTTRSADVRVIAATNRDLETAVRQELFREDLLYRINVIELMLTPLCDRSDLGEIAEKLLAFFARQISRRVTGFSPEALEALKRYRWPGNLRELRNSVERAAILAAGPEVGLADLPERIARIETVKSEQVQVGARVTLDELEAAHIARILRASPSLEDAAEVLGIDPSTLYRKRRRYGL